MPIQPIDLQNLFIRMNQIGKEQAEAKDSVIQHQTVQNSEFAREIDHRDRSVNETEEPSDGPEKLKTREEKAGGREKGGKKKDSDDESEEEKKKKETLIEPYLGHHIDITG